MESNRFMGAFVGFVIGTIVIGIVSMMLLWTPVMGPWIKERRGLADLREAQQNRQILVENAEAQRQVAILKAEGEKEAAALRADAIGIIGEAAQKYPEYRQQEFIGAFADAIQSGAIDQMIYVPTESNIPITEATRNIQPRN